MSEPVTNVEIEDVLSSIRRLVTEDDRSEPAIEKPESGENAGRLVLTPALRVAEAPEPADEEIEPFEEISVGEATDSGNVSEDDEPTAEPFVDGAEEESSFELSDFEEVVEEESVEAVDALAEGDAETDDTRSDPEDPVASDFSENAADDLTHQDGGADTSDDDSATDEAKDSNDLQNPPWKNGENFLFQAAKFVEKADTVKRERLASAEREHHESEDQSDEPNDAAASESITAPEVEHQSDEAVTERDNDGLEAPDSGAEDAECDLTTDHSGRGEDETFEQPSAGFEFSSFRDAKLDLADDNTGQRAASLSAKIEALEAAIAETQDQWEPDGQAGDDYAGTKVDKIVWQDNDAQAAESAEPVELHVSADPESVEAPAEDAGQVISEALEDAVLDEDSLRELVADIVRQELHGALGERITRNVRKLVRREIHRALTTQELD